MSIYKFYNEPLNIATIKHAYNSDDKRIKGLLTLHQRLESKEKKIKDLQAEVRNTKYWPILIGFISFLTFLYTMLYPWVLYNWPLQS